MHILKRIWCTAASVLIGFFLVGCVAMERRPTLDEVRSGNARGEVIDTTVHTGEIRGTIDRIDRSRREIHVVDSNGGRQILPYDVNRTSVQYHRWDYSVDSLEAGDRIAFRPSPRDASFVDTIRVLEPVQARALSPHGSPTLRSRADVVEGTVERVDERLGTFEVRPRTGRMIIVSVPYNARAADVDTFRALRRGDEVRIEGEFINPESFQLLSFISSRG